MAFWHHMPMYIYPSCSLFTDQDNANVIHLREVFSIIILITSFTCSRFVFLLLLPSLLWKEMDANKSVEKKISQIVKSNWYKILIVYILEANILTGID